MSALVPPRRPEIDPAVFKVGAPVSSTTWRAMASLGNWLRGKGAVLVPACTPSVYISVSTNSTFRFRVKPRSSAIQRIWVVYLRADSGRSTKVTLRAPAGSGVARNYDISNSTPLRNPIVYVENLASRSSAEAEITLNIDVDPTSNDWCRVESIACYEQDRPILQADATDYGVDPFSCSSAQPIYDGAYASVGGVYDIMTNADARRVGIFHWSQGDTSGITSAGTTEDLLALPVPVLVRKLARSATSGSVKWAAYARVTAGTGTITLVHTNAALGTSTDAASVTNTSFAWTATRTVAGFDCDNLAAADGRQSSAWDLLNFSHSATGGDLQVRSISVWQDD